MRPDPHITVTFPAITAELEPEFGGPRWTLSILAHPLEHGAVIEALRTAADQHETAVPAYKDTHNAYLLSAEWEERRKRALRRAGQKCQACSGTRELQVHHNTYARVGHEFDTDLFVMCDRCHGRLHGAAAA